MSRQAAIMASVLTALLVVGWLGFNNWARNLELRQSRQELEAARHALAAHTTNAAHLDAELAEARAQIEELERVKERIKDEADRNHKSLESEMRRQLESKDITISELQGKLTVNILDRILFDSGEATLKPEGQDVLRRIAAVLAQYPNRQVHVVGHTDNVPIRAAARHRFASNWELSTARATAAVRFLAEDAGVDPRRLGAVGYGEMRPVADNSTPEGRARNRRIALVVLSEELVGSDAVAPAIAPAGPELDTNAPPVIDAAPPLPAST